MLESKKYQTTTIDLEEKMMEKLTETSKRFGVPKVRIIRLCIENELPRLIERETKRRNYRRADDKN